MYRVRVFSAQRLVAQTQLGNVHQSTCASEMNMGKYQWVKWECDVPYSGKERRRVKVVYYEVVIAILTVSTTTEFDR